MTFTFEGLPRGTSQQVGVYTEAGMHFGPGGVGSLYLSGGGIAGYPDNGTGYLYIPDGWLTFSLTDSLHPTFNLVSFDAARYAALAPPTIGLVGYKVQIMGPVLTVTNYFTVSSSGSDFQTFYPDSSFVNLFQVTVVNSVWSLDNLVISGVPEPSGGALILLGAVFGLGWRWGRKKTLDR